MHCLSKISSRSIRTDGSCCSDLESNLVVFNCLSCDHDYHIIRIVYVILQQMLTVRQTHSQSAFMSQDLIGNQFGFGFSLNLDLINTIILDDGEVQCFRYLFELAPIIQPWCAWLHVSFRFFFLLCNILCTDWHAIGGEVITLVLYCLRRNHIVVLRTITCSCCI